MGITPAWQLFWQWQWGSQGATPPSAPLARALVIWAKPSFSAPFAPRRLRNGRYGMGKESPAPDPIASLII